MLKNVLMKFVTIFAIIAMLGSVLDANQVEVNAATLSSRYGSSDASAFHNSPKFEKSVHVKKVGTNNYQIIAFYEWKVAPSCYYKDYVTLDLTKYASEVSNIDVKYYYGDSTLRNYDSIPKYYWYYTNYRNVSGYLVNGANGHKAITATIRLNHFPDKQMVIIKCNIKLKKSFLNSIQKGKKKKMGFGLEYIHSWHHGLDWLSATYNTMQIMCGLAAFSTGETEMLADGLVSLYMDVENAFANDSCKMAPTDKRGYVNVDSNGNISYVENYNY